MSEEPLNYPLSGIAASVPVRRFYILRFPDPPFQALLCILPLFPEVPYSGRFFPPGFLYRSWNLYQSQDSQGVKEFLPAVFYTGRMRLNPGVCRKGFPEGRRLCPEGYILFRLCLSLQIPWTVLSSR